MKGVLFLPSYYESIKDLPDQERLQMYDAIIEYGLYGRQPELKPLLNALFLLMRPVIDSSSRRYSAAVENGKKGGAPKGNQNARKQPKDNQRNNQTNNQTNNQDYDLDYDLDYDYDLDCDLDLKSKAAKPPRSPVKKYDRIQPNTTVKKFVPPTVEEIAAYCKERENNVDAQKVYDYYSAAEWKDSNGKPVKNWKQKIISVWERKEESQAPDLSWRERERIHQEQRKQEEAKYWEEWNGEHGIV